jgi:heme-degrading monooxygenase HmoA
MDPLAATPTPPYYAVIFTSVRTDVDPEGYAAMAERMVELASGQPGFLGIESVRGPDGVGITISYWESPESIDGWRRHAEHRLAQARGRGVWYARFRLLVCRVEREYGCDAGTSG